MTNNEAILIDINSLLAGEWPQCRALLTYSYSQSNNDNKRAIDNDHLVALLKQPPANTINSITAAIQAELEPVENLDEESYAILKFTDQLFDNYLNNCKLHPSISDTLNKFRAHSAIAMLQQQLPWFDKAFITELLDTIYNHAIGWQPELGRAAERFYTQFEPIINELASTTTLTEACSLGQFPRDTVDPDPVDPALEHRRLTRPPGGVDQHQHVAPL